MVFVYVLFYLVNKHAHKKQEGALVELGITVGVGREDYRGYGWDRNNKCLL